MGLIYDMAVDHEKLLRESIQNTEAIKHLKQDFLNQQAQIDELKAENKECSEWRRTVDIGKKVAKPAAMFGALLAFSASFLVLLVTNPRAGLEMLQSLIKQIWSRLML